MGAPGDLPTLRESSEFRAAFASVMAMTTYDRRNFIGYRNGLEQLRANVIHAQSLDQLSNFSREDVVLPEMWVPPNE